jgi:hypothetical protein
MDADARLNIPERHGGQSMMTKGETRRFEELCAKILFEKDDAQFSEAVIELNRIMDKQEEVNHMMKTRELTPDQMLSLPCPSCGAAINQPCKLKMGPPRFEPHAGRKRAAADAIEETKKVKV